jgi:hypothetical protein
MAGFCEHSDNAESGKLKDFPDLHLFLSDVKVCSRKVIARLMQVGPNLRTFY